MPATPSSSFDIVSPLFTVPFRAELSLHRSTPSIQQKQNIQSICSSLRSVVRGSRLSFIISHSAEWLFRVWLWWIEWFGSFPLNILESCVDESSSPTTPSIDRRSALRLGGIRDLCLVSNGQWRWWPTDNLLILNSAPQAANPKNPLC